MKTLKLEGAALDWAVATCEFGGHEEWDKTLAGVDCISDMTGKLFNPSNDWAQAGPIIERERLAIWEDNGRWEAEAADSWGKGPTPLIAAMRCYVAHKLGDDVDVPAEPNEVTAWA